MTVLNGCGSWHLKTITTVNQRSLVSDHHNKYNNNQNVWNIIKIIKFWHRDTEWANAAGKMALITQGCHKPSACKKHNMNTICKVK